MTCRLPPEHLATIQVMQIAAPTFFDANTCVPFRMRTPCPMSFCDVWTARGEQARVRHENWNQASCSSISSET